MANVSGQVQRLTTDATPCCEITSNHQMFNGTVTFIWNEDLTGYDVRVKNFRHSYEGSFAMAGKRKNVLVS